jgi:hypothetical protein
MEKEMKTTRIVIRGVDLEVRHDGMVIHEVQPYQDQEDILPVLSQSARTEIRDTLKDVNYREVTRLTPEQELRALGAVQDFRSDPTIPWENRRGGMREHSDGLS